MKTTPSALRRLGMLPAGLLWVLAGCEKAPPPAASAPPPKAVVELVPAGDRSKHFEAVSRHLELGGTVFGYMDTDGDVTKLAESVKSMFGTVPSLPPPVVAFVQQDLTKTLDTLGLNEVKALGMSSVPDAADGGFNNRIFLYTPDGRHGLLAALGGAPAAFTNARLAPVDADFYEEMELDLPAVYAVAKEVANQVGGGQAVDQMDMALKAGTAEAGVSALDVISSLKGRVVLLGRLDEKNTIALPTSPPMVIPGCAVLLKIDGLGAALESALAKATTIFTASTEGTMKIYAVKMPLPVEGLLPVIGIEGGTLYVATSQAFLLECFNRKSGLDGDPTFQQALATMGGTGNTLGYLSPKLFEKARQLPAMNPKLDPDTKAKLDLFLQQLPNVKRPLIGVSSNLPDGILVHEYSNHSLKQEMAAGPAALLVMAVGMGMPALEMAGLMPEGATDISVTQMPMGPPMVDPNGIQFSVDGGNPGGRPPGPAPRAAIPPGPPGSVLAQVQTIQRAATAFTTGAHLTFKSALTTLESAASAVTASGGSPTAAQTAALKTALDRAIQLVDAISKRATETAAARAKATVYEAQLQAIKDSLGTPPPTP